MSIDSDEDFEILDVEEDVSGSSDKSFSHQSLVMIAMKRALENGAREMRAGWFQIKQDKNGNVIRTPIEDTRKTFIECVRTVEMIMACDLDKIAEDKLQDLHHKEEALKQFYLQTEENEWTQLAPVIQQKLRQSGKGFSKGKFHTEKENYQSYLEEQVNIYREIFNELTRLTKRLDFYSEVMYTA
jgi:hypothetical protein